MTNSTDKKCCKECWKNLPHPKECSSCNGEGVYPAECVNPDCPCHQGDKGENINEIYKTREEAFEEGKRSVLESLKVKIKELRRRLERNPLAGNESFRKGTFTTLDAVIELLDKE